MLTASLDESSPRSGLSHRTVWRWHFYAGIFCIPFILWLSVTGTIFLFHPQIQHWLDRPYNHLDMVGPEALASAQVRSALAAVPGSTFNAYQLPYDSHSPAQVLVDQGSQELRVYVNPHTAEVLKIDNEDRRLDNFISRLHGELLLGRYGSWIVELAASWAVIMIVTGLFLWWPRSSQGLGGVLYPRLGRGRRIFWRDIHAVTGIYVSFFALFLLFTGLPWAASWGAYLKAARKLGAGQAVQQDWVTNSAELVAARTASQHHHHHGSGTPANPENLFAIDRMVATVAPLHLTNPVKISPPAGPGKNWTAKSDTRNRPQRVSLELDPSSGAILQRTDFHSKPWIDRIVGTGIAAHEGQLFGLTNQLLGLLTTAGLFTLSISSLIMWRRRRPEGLLGAPAPTQRVRFSAGLIAFILIFSIYMPLFGASMILVGLTERFILRRIPATQRWLGLAQIPA